MNENVASMPAPASPTSALVPKTTSIKRVVFRRGMIVTLAGVSFRIAQVNDKVMVLRPLEQGVHIKRK